MKKYAFELHIFCCIMAAVILLGYSQTVFADDMTVPQKSSDNKFNGLDVVLVVDNSKSIWPRQDQRNEAMIAAVNSAVGSDVRIGCVYFADKVYAKYSLKPVGNEEEYRDSFKYLNMTDKDPNNIDTNIGEGLKTAADIFEDQDSERKKVVILLSDGINENSLDDSKYREAANRLTKEQALRLEQNDIDLYCLSINGRNDESYLNELVNYFDGGHRFDTRLVAISPDNIDSLYYEFIKMFYLIRGDVKCRAVSLDADNSYSFTLPELAVGHLQIYVRGSDLTTELIHSTEKVDVQKWTYEKSSFLTVYNPPAGEWIFRVSSVKNNALKDITIMTAYYTQLMASVKVEPVTGDELLKGHSARLEFMFSDGNNNPVNIDSKANISAELTVTDKNSEHKSYELGIENKDGVVSSTPFDINDFGRISVNLKISYGNNIDLEYHIDTENEIVPYAPQTVGKYSNGHIKAETIKDGDTKKYQFMIPLEGYITDKDSPLSSIRLLNVHQYNDNNKLDVRLENEMLVVKAEKCSSVSASIELQDETGLTTKLDVEGSIVDMEAILKVLASLSLIMLLCVIVVVAYWKQKKHRSEDIVNNWNKAVDSLLELLKKFSSNKSLSFISCNPSSSQMNSKQAEWDKFCKDNDIPDPVKKIVYAKNASTVNISDIEKSNNELNDQIVKFDLAVLEKIKNISNMFKELSKNDDLNKEIDTANKSLNDIFYLDDELQTPFLIYYVTLKTGLIKKTIEKIIENIETARKTNDPFTVNGLSEKEIINKTKELNDSIDDLNKNIESYQEQRTSIDKKLDELEKKSKDIDKFIGGFANMMNCINVNIPCTIQVDIESHHATKRRLNSWICCFDDFYDTFTNRNINATYNNTNIFFFGEKKTVTVTMPNGDKKNEERVGICVVDGDNGNSCSMDVGETKVFESHLGSLTITAIKR